MTAQTDLAAIRKIVKNTDHHRTRAVREAWDAIKAVLFGEEPVVEEPLAGEDAAEPVVETADSAPAPEAEGTVITPEAPAAGTAETAEAAPAAAPEGETATPTSRFAETPGA